MTTVVPVNQFDRRPPEAGRIRLGVKTARAMKSIDTFRFTSPHRRAIEQLAEMYGGQAQPWSDPKVAGNQWEVLTQADSIEILAQPGGCTTYYELWSFGGCERRCDGVTVEVAGHDGMDEGPCICNAKGEAECEPITRLNVVLPNIDFYGVWRLQTKGWNAAKELPGSFDMVVALAEAGRMVRAHLHLEKRKKVSRGQTKNFVVPTISLAATPNELLAGEGVARPQLHGGPPAVAELGAGVTPDPDRDAYGSPGNADMVPEVVEAQVVDEALEQELEGSIRTIADEHNLDADAVFAAIWSQAGGDYDKLQRFIARNDGSRKLEWTGKGTLKWTSQS